jgi:ABC-2 type transport system permease protein
MLTVFKHAVARSKGSILGWGLSLGLLSMWMVSLYDTLAKQQEMLQKLFASYPKELWAFFGGVQDIFSPSGYINMELYSYMPLVLGIFVVLAGSGLLVGDEEKGFLDLLMSHPLGRTGLFVGRLLSFVVTLVAILTLIWLGTMIGVQSSINMKIGWGEMWLPNLSLLAILLLFGTLALFLSMVLPSRRLAASVAGLLLVGSYFINAMAEVSTSVANVAKYLPMKYYQGGLAVTGMNWTWFAGLMIAAALFAAVAWWRFEGRDIRVGGEGGWKLPTLRFWRRQAVASGEQA